MSNLLEYKGYHGSVEFSAEDECFFGKIEFINDLIMFEGESPKSIKEAFHQAVDDYLAHCARTGTEPNQPFKGSFNVRVGAALHRNAVIEAKKRGLTLNEIVCEALTCLLNGGTVVHNHNSFHVNEQEQRVFVSEFEVRQSSEIHSVRGAAWTLQ